MRKQLIEATSSRHLKFQVQVLNYTPDEIWILIYLFWCNIFAKEKSVTSERQRNEAKNEAKNDAVCIHMKARRLKENILIRFMSKKI